MYQGNIGDYPDTQRWLSNLIDRIYQQVDLLTQNSEVQETQSSFGSGQRVKNPSSKGKKYKLPSIKEKIRDCIPDF